MSNEPIVQERSKIAEAITQAVATVTGLEPHQITYVEADAEQVLIDYVGARPGLMGGAGRRGRRMYDTKTGRCDDATLSL